MARRKGLKKATPVIGLLWLVLPILPLAGVYAEEEDGREYARVRYLEGNLEVSQLREQEIRSATLNTPLIAGDQVRTSADGRAEIQLQDGSVLRMDRSTRLDLQSLGTPEPAPAVFRLWHGSLFVEVFRGPGSPDRYQIDTPLASVYLQREGQFRIDVPRSGDLVVSSFSGSAEIAGEGSSVVLASGQRTVVSRDGDPFPPVSFNTARRDDFARWSEERQLAYLRPVPSGEDPEPDPYEDLPEEVVPYLPELNRYGGWYHVSAYGWVWRPYYLTVSWRPYSLGNWVYYPSGWNWVSWEPWGWYPYHYGRWHWVAGFGWGWVPGRVYSGAWVSWAYGGDYIGWCPLNYYNQPAFFGLHLSAYDSRGWVFVRYSHFRARNIRSRFVSPRLVQKVERLHRTRRNPRFRPGDLDSPGLGRRLIEEAKRADPSPRGSVPAALLRSFRETDPQENPRFRNRSGTRQDRLHRHRPARVSVPSTTRGVDPPRPANREGSRRTVGDRSTPRARPADKGQSDPSPRSRLQRDPSRVFLRGIIDRIRRPSVRRESRPDGEKASPRSTTPRRRGDQPQARSDPNRPSVSKKGQRPSRRGISRPPRKSQPRARPEKRNNSGSRGRSKKR